jgi:hypothetical protein
VPADIRWEIMLHAGSARGAGWRFVLLGALLGALPRVSALSGCPLLQGCLPASTRGLPAASLLVMREQWRAAFGPPVASGLGDGGEEAGALQVLRLRGGKKGTGSQGKRGTGYLPVAWN